MYLHRLAILLSFLTLLVSCNTGNRNSENNRPDANWKYFGQMLPESTPLVFSPDNISTQRHERDFTLSPDGTELFYSYSLPGFSFTSILHLQFDGSSWSNTRVAPFSGQYNDLEPTFSPDGNQLFFISKRPLHAGDSASDWNIWYCHRSDSTWAEPQAVKEPVNTEKDEYFPSLAKSGNIYFTASLPESFGGEDIYYSKQKNGVYSNPINLGQGVNSPFPEFNAFVDPEEQFILFSSYGREDGYGGGDLYISFSDSQGEWGEAINLGEKINSKKIDYCPFVTHDQKYLFFTSERIDPLITDNSFKDLNQIQSLEDKYSNGLGDIYWVAFDVSKWKK